MGTLKNCIDDDWAHDLRYASVVLIRHLIEALYEHLETTDYQTIYVELLKRLDDA